MPLQNQNGPGEPGPLSERLVYWIREAYFFFAGAFLAAFFTAFFAAFLVAFFMVRFSLTSEFASLSERSVIQI
jgi:hypothetical protein